MQALAFLILLCSISATSAEQLKVNILYETIANPPYYLGQGEAVPADMPGVTLEVLKKVGINLNLAIKFHRKPWIQSLRLLEHGRIDGLFHGSFKPERTRIAKYPMKNGKLDSSRLLMTQSYYLYSHPHYDFTWDGSNLYNFQQSIGAARSYSIVSDLKKMHIQVVETKHALQAMFMLNNKRLGAVASLEHIGDNILRQYPEQLKHIKKRRPALIQKNYYLLLSRQFVDKHPKITEAIWDEIKRIRESGEWDNIVAKYMGQ